MNASTARTERVAERSVRPPLGHVVATPSAFEVARNQGLGAVSEYDARANDHAVREGTRILSAYETAGGMALDHH